MGRLDGKIALITGGASGLGEAMGRLFKKEGAKVVLTDINEEKGSAVANEIGALFFQHDVTDEGQWEDVISKTIEEYGQLNVVVNNAGLGVLGNVEETSYEDWRLVNSVNLDGVFLGTKHAVLNRFIVKSNATAK